MIATLTQTHRMPSGTTTTTTHASRNANGAGGPLPLIPRRQSSTSSSTSSSTFSSISRGTLQTSASLPALSATASFPSSTSPSPSPSSSFARTGTPSPTSTAMQTTTITTITPATPPRDESDSSTTTTTTSTSDGTRPTIRTRRVRGVRHGHAPGTQSLQAVCPPELSTPIPTLAAAAATTASPSPNPGSRNNIGNSNSGDTPKSASATASAPVSTSSVSASGSGSRHLLYTPGMPLRLSVDALKAGRYNNHNNNNNGASETPSSSASGQGSQSASALHTSFPSSLSVPSTTSSLSVSSTTTSSPAIVRKKSGQLVKPSLKPSRSSTPTHPTFLSPSASPSPSHNPTTNPAFPSFSSSSSLSVHTLPFPGHPSKSEPSTPSSFPSPHPHTHANPITPTTPKAVHFDAQLEHVRLFLAEQRPTAVSRDGSPVHTETDGEETSGTDSDFPRWIYGTGGVGGGYGAGVIYGTGGKGKEERRRGERGDGKKEGAREGGRLVMHLANMPSSPGWSRDVVLESLVLSSPSSSPYPSSSSSSYAPPQSQAHDAGATTITGTIRVRNLAYTKLVAVRFTFDAWLTTSEVAARWAESISAEWDRFAFVLRVGEGLGLGLNGGNAQGQGQGQGQGEGRGKAQRRMELAVRYTVDGREVWDNNGGGNYVATFAREGLPLPAARGLSSSASGSSSSASASDREEREARKEREAKEDLADLKSKLEKVAGGGTSSSGSGSTATFATTAAAAFSSSSSSFSMGSTTKFLHQQYQNQRQRQSRTQDDASAAFKSSASFASRYDFAHSLKSAWRPPPLPMPASNGSGNAKGGPGLLGQHHRTHSFPASRGSAAGSASASASYDLSASSNPTSNSNTNTLPTPTPTNPNSNASSSSIPWPQKAPSDPYALRRPALPRISSSSSGSAKQPESASRSLGSPRDRGTSEDVDVFHGHHPVELEGAPFVVAPQPKRGATLPQRRQERGAKTHHRGGYFDLVFPSPTPGGKGAGAGDGGGGETQRFNSFPPVRGSGSGSGSGSGALSPSPSPAERGPTESPMQSPAISTPTPLSVPVYKFDGLLAPPPPSSTSFPSTSATHSASLPILPHPTLTQPTATHQISRDPSTDTTTSTSSTDTTSSSSALSTPSMVTPSSSRSNTPSPTPEMFMRGLRVPMGGPGSDEEDGKVDMDMVGKDTEREGGRGQQEMAVGVSPEAHYRQFLNKFCFFTGPNSAYAPASAPSYPSYNPAHPSYASAHEHAHAHASYHAHAHTHHPTYPSHSTLSDDDDIPRTHSASSIEEFLSGLSPRLEALAASGRAERRPTSPTRSSSLDDLMLSRSTSGSLTPTPSVSRLSVM